MAESDVINDARYWNCMQVDTLWCKSNEAGGAACRGALLSTTWALSAAVRWSSSSSSSQYDVSHSSSSLRQLPPRVIFTSDIPLVGAPPRPSRARPPPSSSPSCCRPSVCGDRNRRAPTDRCDVSYSTRSTVRDWPAHWTSTLEAGHRSPWPARTNSQRGTFSDIRETGGGVQQLYRKATGDRGEAIRSIYIRLTVT